MKMPAFTAEASLFRTNNHYRFANGGSLLADGNATVTPQGCGLFKGIFCGTAIAAGTIACTGLCFYGPAPCAACWTTFLGVAYSACKDCIPDWMRALIDIFEGSGDGAGGGGGGGGSSTPPPALCDRGEKCCELDDDGSCALCVPLHAHCP